MKSLTIPVFIVLTTFFALSQSAFAATTDAKSRTPQQERMANCSHESKGMKGDERKKFMSDCLKGKTTGVDTKNAAAKAESMNDAKSEKLKTCKAEAKSKNLKGKDRGTFLNDCMKDDAR